MHSPSELAFTSTSEDAEISRRTVPGYGYRGNSPNPGGLKGPATKWRGLSTATVNRNVAVQTRTHYVVRR